MKITKQELKKIIIEEIEATVEEGFYYGPKDYSRDSGGGYTSDRSKSRSSRTSSGYPGGTSKASGPMSAGEKAAAMERCKEKGMMYTVRDDRIICVHEESLDEDGSEEVQEMFDYSGTRDGPKSEKYYSDKRKKEKTGPRHEKDYADDRKNKKTRPSNAPQKYQRHYEE